MKKLFTYGFALALAMIASAEPSLAYNQVRLTFNRTGTAVGTVTVNVTDETGAPIDGATATLLSVKQGVGSEADVQVWDVSLKKGVQLDNHPEMLCADYANNVSECFSEFTFKISGISGFVFNHSDLQLAGLNGQSKFQNTYPRKFDVKVWGDENKSNSIASRDKVDVCANVLKAIDSGEASGTALYDYDNTNDWEIKNTATTTAEDEQIIVVRLIRMETVGCFCGLKQITLYNGYRFSTTATSNLDNVATFSASNNVVFDTSTTAYIATTIEGDNSKVKLSPIEGALLATKGAIVSKTESGDAYAYIDAETATDTRTNHLVGGGDNAMDLTTGSYYIFNKQGDEAVFSPLSANGTLAANKAALAYNTSDAQSLSITFGDVTGIDVVTDKQGNVGGFTYDLSGRRVDAKKLPAGIYVSNGKKVIVK